MVAVSVTRSIVKYCILSVVCMIKTVPHSTVLSQMWRLKTSHLINGEKVGLHAPRFVDKILLSKLVERKKFGLIFFPGLINLRWPRAIMALKCDRRWLLFWGCTYEALLGYLGLFANYFSLKSLSLFLKSHMNVL